MIEPPSSYQNNLSNTDLETIGRLAVSWSATEHVIGNCLKAVFRQTDEEAQITVFPLPLERKLEHLKNLISLPNSKWNQEARDLLKELAFVMKALQFVRNNVIHALVIDDRHDGGVQFHLRSKNRTMEKDEALSVEELTNYAAHVALHLRLELSFKLGPGMFSLGALPDRPPIPEFLRSYFPAK